MKKINLPELVSRILILIILLFTINSIIKLKIEEKNNRIIGIEAARNNKLRIVNKINTYIEEQVFLFSKIEQANENSSKLLDEIERNIENLEKKVNQKQVENLINKNKMEEIKLNIQLIKQIEKNI